MVGVYCSECRNRDSVRRHYIKVKPFRSERWRWWGGGREIKLFLKNEPPPYITSQMLIILSAPENYFMF